MKDNVHYFEEGTMAQKPCRARLEFIKDKHKFNHYCCLLSLHEGYKHYDPVLLITVGGERVTHDVNGLDITKTWSPFIEKIDEQAERKEAESLKEG